MEASNGNANDTYLVRLTHTIYNNKNENYLLFFTADAGIRENRPHSINICQKLFYYPPLLGY